MNKIAQNMMEDLQVLAHHAKTTGKNLEFTAEQIQEIKRVITDLMLAKPLAYEEKLKWRDERITELEKQCEELLNNEKNIKNFFKSICFWQ